MFYFLYNITETAYYNLIIVSKYVCSSPLSNLSPVLTIIWMGGCSRDQKDEGRADFDGITCIWKGHMSLFQSRTYHLYIPHKYISRAKWVMYPAQLVYLYPAQNHFPLQIGNVSRAISLYPAQSVYILSLVYLFISHPKSFPAQLVYILHNQFIFRV